MKDATLERVKRAIRDRFAWPGGYRLHVVMDDGMFMCTDCARENYRLIAQAVRYGDRGGGWSAVGAEPYWAGDDEPCAHCGKVIESEYGNLQEASA